MRYIVEMPDDSEGMTPAEGAENLRELIQDALGFNETSEAVHVEPLYVPPMPANTHEATAEDVAVMSRQRAEEIIHMACEGDPWLSAAVDTYKLTPEGLRPLQMQVWRKTLEHEFATAATMMSEKTLWQRRDCLGWLEALYR